MSIIKFFGKVAVSTAIGLNAASAAEATTDKSATSPLPYSVRELRDTISIPSNVPLVTACFKEQSVQEKPLHEMLPQTAQKVVDCANQKIIDQFIKNPGSNDTAITHFVSERNFDDRVPEMLRASPHEIAAECTKRNKVLVGNFAQCASELRTEKGIRSSLTFAGALVAGIAGSLMLIGLTGRKRDNDSAPGSQPS